MKRVQIGAAVVVAACGAAAQASLLYNGGFDIVGPSGPSTSYSGLFAGPSAADGFEVFNNAETTTRTSLEPTTLAIPGASPNMIHVATFASNCGISELFGLTGSGPASATFSVWLRVVSGTVGVGVGDGGNTSMSSFAPATGQWVLLSGVAANTPANNFIIYSASPGGAEWYADLADVTPAPGAGGLLGLAGIVACRRRR